MTTKSRLVLLEKLHDFLRLHTLSNQIAQLGLDSESPLLQLLTSLCIAKHPDKIFPAIGSLVDPDSQLNYVKYFSGIDDSCSHIFRRKEEWLP